MAVSDRAFDSSSAGSAERLRRLLEATIALDAELSVPALLRGIAQTALTLTGARYAALGVLGPLGTVEEFVTVGIDDEIRARIPEQPTARGMLGVLGGDRRPLRLRDLSQDPRAVGFPPGHPPMRSLLAVPIDVRGAPFADLYLAEKLAGDEFGDEDEKLVVLLAAHAAVAIENARLLESARRWSRQLESLNEVSEALTSEIALSKVLELAAARLRTLLDATGVMIALPTIDGRELVTEAVAADDPERIVGLRLARDSSKMGQAFREKRSARIDSVIDDPVVDQSAARLVGSTATLVVPMIVGGRALGVIAAWDKLGSTPRFDDADLLLAEAFANRAALAVELSERVGREAVRALVEGQELERKRLARELHDETAQGLASIMLGLNQLEGQVGEEPLALIRALVGSTLEDVRRLAVELRPPVLDDFGLRAALARLALAVGEKTGIDVRVSFASEDTQLTSEQETALYRIVQESLANVAEHAAATTARVSVAAADGRIRLVVEDDGGGYEPAAVGDGALGVVGMRERAQLLGGRLTVDSAPNSGTRVVVELPDQSAS